MKVKRYKLKDSVTIEEINTFGVKKGGSWISETATGYIVKFIHRKDRDLNVYLDFAIYICFSNNLSDWNDFDNVLLIDEDFGQPFHSFYVHYNEEVDNFPVLEKVIAFYNEFMDSLPFLEEKEE